MGDGSGDEVMDDRASYQGTSEEEEINEEGSSDEVDSSGNSDDNEGVINEIKKMILDMIVEMMLRIMNFLRLVLMICRCHRKMKVVCLKMKMIIM